RVAAKRGYVAGPSLDQRFSEWALAFTGLGDIIECTSELLVCLITKVDVGRFYCAKRGDSRASTVVAGQLCKFQSLPCVEQCERMVGSSLVQLGDAFIVGCHFLERRYC